MNCLTKTLLVGCITGHETNAESMRFDPFSYCAEIREAISLASVAPSNTKRALVASGRSPSGLLLLA